MEETWSNTASVVPTTPAENRYETVAEPEPEPERLMARERARLTWRQRSVDGREGTANRVEP